MFTKSIERVHEIRNFHVRRKKAWCMRKVVVLLIFFFFCHSLYYCCCPCLSFLLLWSKIFATTAMWCHISPLYTLFSLTHFPLNCHNHVRGFRHVPSIPCDVISCQGQLCHLTCTGWRGFSNHTRMSTIQSRGWQKRVKTMQLWPQNSHENLVLLPTYLSIHLILRS